ncbi:vWA domain-containing protein [Desulfogranum marinum]|uniref:vWA domain-containing protein n=1 Tax=Desulfogranum marinum TaxID=453220 RepID=UPI0019624A89|nr:vWA domain-containing protein [Desulfogranum marinum]MBM9514881.1 VWA domain-containing protein [Desulfogranum marinum]
MQAIILLAALLPVYLLPGNILAESKETDKRVPLKIEGKDVLPLRVLSRAFSNIYKDPSDQSTTVEENVSAFQAFYVYDKQLKGDLEESGWYEVGADNRGTVLGWMKADDVFEWKQTMCLSYTHPEGRKPVLMFEKKDGLEKYLDMANENRLLEITKLYEAIDNKTITSDFPVKSVEPKMAIDITKEFYLLPILSFKQVDFDNREGRLVQLAAVTKGKAGSRDSSDIRSNEEYLESAVADTASVNVKSLENFTVDVVWVMDTTNSMMSYIQQTLKVAKKTSQQISTDNTIASNIKFGIWGYRDSEEIPEIGYNVHNYTPELQDIDQFVTTLESVDVTKEGSKGYAEDVFSGMHATFENTQWTPNAMRLVILVGDAPSHELGHKWNASGQNEKTLRTIASDRKITVFAIHIKDPNPKAQQYHAIAEQQFQSLSLNKGMGEQSSYMDVASDDITGFEQTTKEITAQILSMLGEIKQVKAGSVQTAAESDYADTAQDPSVSSLSTIPVPQPSAFDKGEATVETKTQELADGMEEKSLADNDKEESTSIGNLDLFSETPQDGVSEKGQETAQSLVKNTIKAALVEWIGSQVGAQAPRDIVAWVADKDLMDPAIQSLEVRFLVNKRQLDALRTTLDTILKAGRTGQISGDDFFSSLQAASATTARDPNLIGRAQSLAKTGLVPEFLVDLPYTSIIMDINNELWNSWSADEQDMFLADLEARIMAYETIHDSPEGWVQLNRNDDPDEFVYPIPLELLP